MITAPIIERLQAAQAQLDVQSVKGVGDLMEALKSFNVARGLFVMRTGGQAGPSTTATMATRQSGETRFGVISAFSGAGLKGPKDMLDAVTEGVIAQLLGWMHPLADAPVEYRGESLLLNDVERQLLFHQQIFAIPRLFKDL